MKKNKKVIDIMITMGGCVVGSAIASGAILGPYFGGKAYNEKMGRLRYGDTWDYYMKTQWNKPIRLPIYNNTIAVMFNNFSELAKENAMHAISKLDDVLKKQSFTIYDNENKPKDKNYIKISLVNNLTSEDDGKDYDTIAKTYLDYNHRTGMMKYPVRIEIERKYVNTYRDNANQNHLQDYSVFSSIVQHELGHALGLDDLYRQKDVRNSAMFYLINYGSYSYSELDKHNIRHIYDKEHDVEYEVSVRTPNQTGLLSYYDDTKNEHNEDETTM